MSWRAYRIHVEIGDMNKCRTLSSRRLKNRSTSMSGMAMLSLRPSMRVLCSLTAEKTNNIAWWMEQFIPSVWGGVQMMVRNFMAVSSSCRFVRRVSLWECEMGKRTSGVPIAGFNYNYRFLSVLLRSHQWHLLSLWASWFVSKVMKRDIKWPKSRVFASRCSEGRMTDNHISHQT